MTCSEISRREFLSATSLGIAATATSKWLKPHGVSSIRKSADHCIMLVLSGGPSQLDTWDMKPDAITEVRGPYKPIATNVAGIQISEIFPRMAKQADKYALVRSVHSTSKPLHDIAQRELKTGRPSHSALEYPCCGAVVADHRAKQSAAPGHVILSRSICDSGIELSIGARAPIGPKHTPASAFGPTPYRQPKGSQNLDRFAPGDVDRAFDVKCEPAWIRERYGHHDFGSACLAARRLVEQGVTFVTVDVFDPAVGQNAWDIHGSRPFPAITSYRDEIGPMFDQAYSALLEDLQSRGLLQSVLVFAVGEFGRTPRINSHGGRDHWTGCWTAVFAGGGVRGGQLVGASDAIGSEPRDRPVTLAQIVATVYHALGISVDSLVSGPQGEPMRVVESGADPILELF